jgi:hypothetical protein
MLGYGMYGTVLNVPHKWGCDISCSLPLRRVSPTGTSRLVASPGVPKNGTFCGEKKMLGPSTPMDASAPPTSAACSPGAARAAESALLLRGPLRVNCIAGTDEIEKVYDFRTSKRVWLFHVPKWCSY